MYKNRFGMNNLQWLIFNKSFVDSDPNAPFSIATTIRCRGGRYSFPVLLHFTLDA